MNRRISDLLDGYEDDSVELSGETPLSPARIRELAMKKIAPGKKTGLYRLPVRLLAAAAMLAALTVSAFAVARALGAGELMQHLFTVWSPGPLTTAQVESLNEVGRVFDGSGQYSVTSNGAAITFISALADEDRYYLRLRVEAPEGVVLPDLSGEDVRYSLWGDLRDTGPLLETDGGQSCQEYFCRTLPDDDPADNVKDIILMLGGGGLTYNDGGSKRLNIYGLWIDAPDGSGRTYDEVFRGTFQFDIGAHFESRMAVIDCGGAAWTDPDAGETNLLDTMKLSPLGVRFDFRTNLRRDNERRRPEVPGDVRIVMKDGSEVFIGHNCGYLMYKNRPGDINDPYYQIGPGLLTDRPEWDVTYYHGFFKPLELDQVDYVQFGQDYVYPIRAD